MNRIALILRARGLGGFLTAVPALRALREALPRHEFVLATPLSLLPVVRLSGCADRVLHTPDVRLLHSGGVIPGIAVDMQGEGPLSQRALRSLRPGRLVAFGRPEVGSPGPRWVEQEHEVHRWCRLVESSFAVRCDADDLDLAEPMYRYGPSGAVVIHIGAGHESRYWPVDRFARVAGHMAGRGHEVLLTGSARERGRAETVRRRAGLAPETVLAGDLGLGELASVVSRAALVISVDTGVAHLATAYRRRSVTLFGTVPPARNGPPPRPHHVVLWEGGGEPGASPAAHRPGDIRTTRVDPRLAAIEADQVIDACERVLATVPIG